MTGDDPEQEFQERQDAGLYPIGRALRSTYHADNHDTLGSDLTGLMLELARVEPPAVVAPSPVAVAPPPTSWFRRLFGWGAR